MQKVVTVNYYMSRDDDEKTQEIIPEQLKTLLEEGYSVKEAIPIIPDIKHAYSITYILQSNPGTKATTVHRQK
jgi:DNA-binding HxlR family transcriptional regulator